MNYKPLAKSFQKGKFLYEEVWREGDFAIYKQTRPDLNKSWWEAIQLGRHDGYTIAGVQIEPSEVYPSGEKWGAMGFTCMNLEEAQARIKQMREKLQQSLDKPRKKK